jgi:hypothetical protein
LTDAILAGPPTATQTEFPNISHRFNSFHQHKAMSQLALAQIKREQTE